MLYLGVTSMMAFNTCRRQFDLENLRRLEPDQPALHFFLGSAVHVFLEKLYSGWKDDLPDDQCADLAFDAMDAYYDAEVEKTNQEYGQFVDYDELYDAYSLAHDMCEHYLVSKAKTDRERWEILDVELSVSYEFAPGLTLRGKIDLVVVEKDTGRLLIVDHKTSKYGHKDGAPGLDIDEQITAYAWLYQQNTGKRPNAYMYNVLLKKAPPSEEPPLIRDGKALTQRKTGIKWTAETYRKAINDNGFEIDEYLEYLEFLDGINYSAEYFDRISVYRSVSALDNFERRLHLVGNQMQEAINEPDLLYPNPATFRCNRCSVRPVCVAIENDENVQAVIDLSFRIRS